MMYWSEHTQCLSSWIVGYARIFKYSNKFIGYFITLNKCNTYKVYTVIHVITLARFPRLWRHIGQTSLQSRLEIDIQNYLKVSLIKHTGHQIQYVWNIHWSRSSQKRGKRIIMYHIFGNLSNDMKTEKIVG